MGKLDTLRVNGPEGEVVAWDAVGWRQVQDDVRRLRQRIFTARQAGDLKRVRGPDRPRGLLEPVAWKAGMAGCMLSR